MLRCAVMVTCLPSTRLNALLYCPALPCPALPCREGHQMGVEQELVEELQRRGRVKVHRTPCLKYRHCGQSEEQHATGVCDPDTLLPAAPPPPPLPAPA